MRTALPLFSGSFFVMALSNAIVPVLPVYAAGSGIQGTIYAAYFLGAFLSTLPSGLLSDRFGRIPLIRAGLLVTAAAGLLLVVSLDPVPVMIARFIEGIGSGCFVAAALSYINSRSDHERMSGYFMALLNSGLVAGLVLSGWIASVSGEPLLSVLVFAGLLCVPACLSFLLQDIGEQPAPFSVPLFLSFVRDFRYLWLSSVVLIGITGVVSSLYPQFSHESSVYLGYWIAGMSIATIGAVLVASRASFPPLSAIRWSAVLMAAGVVFSFCSPYGFVVLGVLAGIVMIAQMDILAGIRDHQGVLMGLYTTTGYLGMSVLPFLAGLVADACGFFVAFGLFAVFAVMVAVTIGRCPLPDRAQ